MFRGWDNFYMLLGTVAGALIGLMFIVVTLTGGLDRERALRGASRFMTPTVVQFSTVMVIGAVCLSPLDDGLRRALLAVLGLGALIFSLADTLRMFLRKDDGVVHWSDPWCYAIGPAIGYAVLGVSALAGWALVLAAVTLATLLCGIRNAWDLITWLAPGVGGDKPDPPPG